MSVFFLDSSAVVKRYRYEPGSRWMRALTDPAAGHAIIICEITLAEVTAALAASQRAPGGISLSGRDRAIALFVAHSDSQYELVAISRPLIRSAVKLTQNHKLRGCDAVQLAAAISAHRDLLAAGLAPLTFVAADENLLSAARAEGLSIENPHLHS